MFKRCKIVMLPTNQKAGTIWMTTRGTLIHTHVSGEYTEKYKPYHLYIISDEEIKEGDWFVSKLGTGIYQAKRGIGWNGIKIIATTDTSIVLNSKGIGKPVFPEYLPQPSQSFIEKYITEYNKGNVISDVLVEYEIDYNEEWDDLYDSFNWNTHTVESIELKVSKDNTITIKKVKDSWTREEVIALCKSVSNASWNECNRTSNNYFTGFNEWIEKNL